MANKTNAAAKGLTTKHIILIFGSLVIIGAAVIIGIILLRPAKTESLGPKVITKANVSEILGEVKDDVAEGMFETYMNTVWEFPDGKSASSNAVMGNAAGNTHSFWFTLTLKDSQDLLYTSDLLPVGTKLNEVKLEKKLKKGSYPAVITVHLVDDKGEDIKSNMSFNITLNILK